MADVFISFRTDDTPRVQAVHDAFRARGLTVFWSNDIPKGAPNYQAIIKEEITKAPVVVVVWTNASVHSGPVIQECSQAERANKLFQILLDEIEPIDIPMEVKYKSQKTMLVGWGGDTGHREWVKLNEAIDKRLGQTATEPLASSVTAAISEDRIKVDARIIHGAPDSSFMPGAGRTEWFKDIGVGPEMVVVPGADFLMGSPDGQGMDDERPQHRVAIARPFAVSRYAITFEAWDAAISDGGVRHKPKDEGWGRAWRPVINVSWNDAKEYAAWLSKKTGKPYRLPSEAEWEFCCRARSATEFYTGKSISKQQAQFTASQTIEVGRFPPNAWGLYDMHGNVWEWCEDHWHHDYHGAPQDGSVWADGGTSARVVRGGAWNLFPNSLRAGCRRGQGPDSRVFSIGFRIARTLN